jgi:DNA mismatch repair ATPase MutS
MKLFASLKTKFLVWVWNHTPICAEMSRLTSRALEQPLTLKMRIKMRLHFVICAWCRRYFEQINFLSKTAPRLSFRLEELPGRGLSAEAKERIKTQVRKNLTMAM